MRRRRGKRRKKLLDDIKEKWRYWKLREEALDRPLRRNRFGRLWTCLKTGYRMNRLVSQESAPPSPISTLTEILHPVTPLHDWIPRSTAEIYGWILWFVTPFRRTELYCLLHQQCYSPIKHKDKAKSTCPLSINRFWEYICQEQYKMALFSIRPAIFKL